jgi:hypothetical protein
MNLATLKKILSYGELIINSYDIRKELFDTAALVTSEWEDDWRKAYFGPPTEKDSITYAKCVRCEVELRNKKVIAVMQVWDGDSFSGAREGRRCSFTFCINKISPTLNRFASWHLDALAETEVQREDEEILARRITATKLRLLEEAKPCPNRR